MDCYLQSIKLTFNQHQKGQVLRIVQFNFVPSHSHSIQNKKKSFSNSIRFSPPNIDSTENGLRNQHETPTERGIWENKIPKMPHPGSFHTCVFFFRRGIPVPSLYSMGSFYRAFLPSLRVPINRHQFFPGNGSKRENNEPTTTWLVFFPCGSVSFIHK